MGSTFVVMTALKLATMGVVGIGLTTAFQYFLNFEFKTKKKDKGEHGGESDAIESLRQKSRSIG
jgi:hypothetical protein